MKKHQVHLYMESNEQKSTIMKVIVFLKSEEWTGMGQVRHREPGCDATGVARPTCSVRIQGEEEPQGAIQIQRTGTSFME